VQQNHFVAYIRPKLGYRAWLRASRRVVRESKAVGIDVYVFLDARSLERELLRSYGPIDFLEGFVTVPNPRELNKWIALIQPGLAEAEVTIVAVLLHRSFEGETYRWEAALQTPFAGLLRTTAYVFSLLVRGMNLGGRERPRDARAMSLASPATSGAVRGLLLGLSPANEVQLGHSHFQVRDPRTDSPSARLDAPSRPSGHSRRAVASFASLLATNTDGPVSRNLGIKAPARLSAVSAAFTTSTTIFLPST
jgi:hypothetical protein